MELPVAVVFRVGSASLTPALSQRERGLVRAERRLGFSR